MPDPTSCVRPSWRCALVAAGALLLVGCGTLPDASRLADASVQLRSAIGASGSTVATELRAARLADKAKEFNDAWAQTDRSCAALVQYAEALSGIVKAGGQGGEAVQRLAAAGTELAAGVGLALPVAGAGAATVDLAAYVYGQVALARAAKSLEESLAHMQPAVERIAVLITGQLDDAGVILAAANQLEALRLRSEFEADTGYREALRRERRSLYGGGPLAPATAQRLEQIDRIERILQLRLDPMEQQLAAGARRLRQATQLVDAAKQAVSDWAGAHRQLLVAVRESRAVDPQALLKSIEELRALVRKVRETS